MIPKSFKYGDLWPGRPVDRKNGHGMTKVDPSVYLTNKAYTNFIDTLGYNVYLDYDMNGIAQTIPNDHTIIINANYTDTVITALLKHELGHLMLFNGNAFFSVDNNTMRSIIAKKLYTPDKINKYGIDQLLRVENIIQDIIIETVLNGKCVCNALMEDYGYHNGVMHLGNLESVSQITDEVCDNVLVPIKNNDNNHTLDNDLKSTLLGSIVDDLKDAINQKQEAREAEKAKPGHVKRDTRNLFNEAKRINRELNHIEEQKIKINKMKERNLEDIKKYEQKINDTEYKISEIRQQNEINEKQKSTRGLERKLDNLKQKLDSAKSNEIDKKMDENLELLDNMKNDLNKKLNEVRKQLASRDIEGERRENQQKRLDLMQKSIDRDKELLEELENELKKISNEKKNNEDRVKDNGFEVKVERSGISASSGIGGSGQIPITDGGPNVKDDNVPQRNLTDHLLRSDLPKSTNGRAYSWDIGQPMLTRLSKKDRGLLRNYNPIKLFKPVTTKKPIRVHQDSLNNPVPSEQMKTADYEATYFRSNKREINTSDMLKGKRKKRFTGVNVLIGLDVSGSMVEEWKYEYQKISDMVNKIGKKLDIHGIKYFTYNTDIVKVSNNIDDLKPFPHGGNAFAYVYQKIMTKIPLMLRNEIILVTDCGDNLGFKLSDVCIGDNSGEEIINHISVIDTETAGFYAMNSDFDSNDWSIHQCTDNDIEKSILNDINKLIEK